ncbi:dTDP-4-dehydrorhamnose reductase [Methylophaga sulfidovorans]|uniref:dTDP-4-dehydrorhamnose reductase n=1 Tax=Methylophaga sulfidovorans TaxID=45496 RepID=A0A1I3YLH1_9GAMM|nr:dTDP-4-dehydrorhamnose reductase [Methylophaga sulfidovorans]SFK32787.1 dTDP-4-dehydrorhamnose reductase [Methylophaga sulfidovorans]
MRILITGKNGQVGHELIRSLSCLGEVIATDSQTLDLSKIDELAEKVEHLAPDLIVNAAAYTAVDRAETEQELAYKINALAPQILAEVAKSRDIPLIHYSTDYVFNGSGDKAWIEDAETQPLNVYGRTKLAGELAISSVADKYLIFRTSWVYGERGANFLNTMKRLAIDKVQLSIVHDQIGTPTWSRHIADVTAQVISQSYQQADFWQKHSGIYHLSGAGRASWFDFAQQIFNLMAAQGHSVPQVHPITTRDYPTPANRPAHSLLDNTKLKQHFGLNLPDWRISLEWVMSGQN